MKWGRETKSQNEVTERSGIGVIQVTELELREFISENELECRWIGEKYGVSWSMIEFHRGYLKRYKLNNEDLILC